MGFNLKVLRHGEGDFFQLLGPFFCSRKVHKELGEPLASDEGMTWFVAVEGGCAVGFCTLRETADSYWLDYSYTAEGSRGKGVQTKLDALRAKHLATLPPRPLRVSCRSPHWPHWEKQGFKANNRRGDWFFGVKEAASPKAKARKGAAQ